MLVTGVIVDDGKPGGGEEVREQGVPGVDCASAVV